MLINAIEGVIENGQVRLSEGVSLPDHTKVFVIIADSLQAAPTRVRTPHLAHPEQSRDFRKQVLEERAANAKL